MAMKNVLALAVIALVGFAAVADAQIELTPSNFDKEILESGKSAMVMYYAPWCGHCKNMKPTWEQLGKKYKSDKKFVIGRVNCDDQKSLCSDVQGFPTIKYFNAGDTDGGKYEEARDFNSLETFLKNLGPACMFDQQENCDDDDKALLAEYAKMTTADRDAKLEEFVKSGKDAEENLQTVLEQLQKTYEETKKATDDALALSKKMTRLIKSIKTTGDGEL